MGVVNQQHKCKFSTVSSAKFNFEPLAQYTDVGHVLLGSIDFLTSVFWST